MHIENFHKRKVIILFLRKKCREEIKVKLRTYNVGHDSIKENLSEMHPVSGLLM